MTKIFLDIKNVKIESCNIIKYCFLLISIQPVIGCTIWILSESETSICILKLSQWHWIQLLETFKFVFFISNIVILDSIVNFIIEQQKLQILVRNPVVYYCLGSTLWITVYSSFIGALSNLNDKINMFFTQNSLVYWSLQV